MLCPHVAEHHVHLDATQLAGHAPHRSGTLREGIRNPSKLREGLTHDDVIRRASQTIRWYVAHRTTRIRTHVDTGSRVAAEARLALRGQVTVGMPGIVCDGQPIPVELQIVAFPQVRLGIGHDSVIDPWYGLGTANLLDAASMAIHLGHLTSEDQLLNWFQRLYTDNHLPFGTPPKVAEGAPANLLWFDAQDPIDVMRKRPLPKVVVQDQTFNLSNELRSEIGR